MKNKVFTYGFTLIDVMIGVTAFSVIITLLFSSVAGLVQLEHKKRDLVYNKAEQVSTIIETYYNEYEKIQ